MLHGWGCAISAASVGVWRIANRRGPSAARWAATVRSPAAAGVRRARRVPPRGATRYRSCQTPCRRRWDRVWKAGGRRSVRLAAGSACRGRASPGCPRAGPRRCLVPMPVEQVEPAKEPPKRVPRLCRAKGPTQPPGTTLRAKRAVVKRRENSLSSTPTSCECRRQSAAGLDMDAATHRAVV